MTKVSQKYTSSSFTGISLQYKIEKFAIYNIRGEYSDAQLYTTAGGGSKIVGSLPQEKRTDSHLWYDCGKHGHIYVDLPLCSSGAQVHTQSTIEPRDMTVTSLETYEIDDDTSTHLEQFSLSAAL